MRKSSTATRNYRPGGSRNPVALATFRDQMADYARAEYLRELRDATHLSRERIAGEVGVSTKTVYAWENGGSIRWDNAKKLAGVYSRLLSTEVDPESIVTRELVEPPLNGNANGNGDGPDLATVLKNQDDIRRDLAELAASVAALAEVTQSILVRVRRLRHDPPLDPPEEPGASADSG